MKPSATAMSSIARGESGESTKPIASTRGWGVGAIAVSYAGVAPRESWPPHANA